MNFEHWRYTLRGMAMEWLRRPQDAIVAYRNALKANPADIAALRSIAWLQGQLQQWDAAVAAWQQVATQLPEHADSHFNLGFALEQRGDLEGALNAFRRATEINPRHDRSWYGQGLIHTRRGDPVAAAAALEHAATLQPMNGPAWLALGMAYHHAHRPDEVKRIIIHCIQHDPPTARRLIRDAQRADLLNLLPR